MKDIKLENNTLDIVIIGTMSAGKSTVINSLIGQELFHSANEATTATITKIHDKDNLQGFSAKTFGFNNELIEKKETVTSDDLQLWNRDSQIKTIDLIGDVKMLQNSELEVVLIDTPGPNNSQNNNHAKLTLETLNNGHYAHIIYILNASQLGVNDDYELLMEIKNLLNKQKNKKDITFLLNKADCLDEDNGEIIDDVIVNANKYLQNIGFDNAKIIATSAITALICQKVMNKQKLTRVERRKLKELFNYPQNYLYKNNLSLDEQLNIESLLIEKKGVFTRKNPLLELKNKNEFFCLLLEKLGWIKIHNEKLFISKSEVYNLYLQSGFAAIQYLIQKKLNNI